MTSKVAVLVHGELTHAKRLLEGYGPAVSIYGGARVKPDSDHYRRTVEVAKALSAAGISVISGGGPGIMEAANLGCKAGGKGLSVGLNIKLPFEQRPNEYQDIEVFFESFAARKIAFCKYSCAFIAAPGGLGTLDELFEVLTLIQTGKMQEMPVLLYGADFWAGLMQWLTQKVMAEGLVAPEDLSRRMRVVDTVDEVMSIVQAQLAKLPAPAAA